MVQNIKYHDTMKHVVVEKCDLFNGNSFHTLNYQNQNVKPQL